MLHFPNSKRLCCFVDLVFTSSNIICSQLLQFSPSSVYYIYHNIFYTYICSCLRQEPLCTVRANCAVCWWLNDVHSVVFSSSFNYISLCPHLPSVLWHCWLGDRKGIRPVKSWVLVCWWWQSDWSFARLTAPVMTTTSVIFSSNKHRLTRVYLERYVLKRRKRERESERARERERERERVIPGWLKHSLLLIQLLHPLDKHIFWELAQPVESTVVQYIVPLWPISHCLCTVLAANVRGEYSQRTFVGSTRSEYLGASK